MKIGIIGAMSEEVSLLTANLSNISEQKIAGQCFIVGMFKNHEIIILQCGIGKVNAAIGTTLLLHLYQPDYVINTGVAGGLCSSLKVGDIVAYSEVRYHDVDLTAFGYEFGQMAQMPAYYLPSDYLLGIAEKCLANITVNNSNNSAKKNLIVSGDSFINNTEQINIIKARFTDACVVDMESGAIAQVCHLLETPFIIIRSISDVPDSVRTESFTQFLTIAADKSAKLVIEMLKKINHNQ